MITQKDATAIAVAIAGAARREIKQSDGENKRIWSIRGAAFGAVEDIWYDVLPLKTREVMGNNCEIYREIFRKVLDDDAAL